MTAFLDFAPEDWDEGVAFWAAATGSRVSPTRGEYGELATLLPPDGDPHLRVQRLGDGPSRVHLDLHSDDPQALADALVELGAQEVARHDDFVVLASPGGLPFCSVESGESALSASIAWPGHRSRMDQVCLDIPAAAHDREVRFWADVLDVEPEPSPHRHEFTDLRRPEHLPLRFLLQRVGHEGPVSAHLDVATDDRAAEIARLEALGASVVGPGHGWTVLQDPVGRVFCVTDRVPIS